MLKAGEERLKRELHMVVRRLYYPAPVSRADACIMRFFQVNGKKQIIAFTKAINSSSAADFSQCIVNTQIQNIHL
jgi:hypothetical protein